MTDQILRGSRSWTVQPGSVDFGEQFDAALEILCTYARDALRLQSAADINLAGRMYFGSLSFQVLGDIYGAVTVVGTTPQNLIPPSFNRFLEYVPVEWANPDGIGSLLEMIREHALDEQLRRVWRSPTSFDRDIDFDSELGRRAMELSLPATEWSGPLRESVVVDALAALVADHERSMGEPDFLVAVVAARSDLGRREARQLKRQLRRGSWPPLVQRCFADHTNDLNQVLVHVVSFSNFVGWHHVRHPMLRPAPSAPYPPS